MVAISLDAPLDIMALPLMFFQNRRESAIASTSGILSLGVEVYLAFQI